MITRKSKLTPNDSEMGKLLFVKSKNGNVYFSIIPVVIFLITMMGFFDNSRSSLTSNTHYYFQETKGGKIKNAGKFNILSSDDITSGIKDTVFTDKENWLELRIDQQMLYQHWRDGRTIKFPVSSGNNKGSDPEALESRPGLFAIFQKTEHHQSSQFDAANMYHFMPFNQGIGFHSIDGTGYYSHLGVRPSSHGCIRMKHEDAKQLFIDSPLGTLVLASKGKSARTIAFAQQEFKNERDYEKDEFKFMLANNLYNIANGRYFLEDKTRFIINPKVIPVSGIYTGYDLELPDRQILPRSFTAYYSLNDRLYVKSFHNNLLVNESNEMIELISEDSVINIQDENKKMVSSSNDLIKKYFNNPIGVLPYFGPKR